MLIRPPRHGWVAAFGLATILYVLPAQGDNSGPVAAGRVEPAGPVMTIGVAASGIVGEILVHEGMSVQSGQILVRLDCHVTEADVRNREGRLAAAQAAFDRARNGPRPDEIAVGEAVVGYSQARAEEAKKTLDRTEALQEGVTVSTARVLEVQRDARITAAQLAEARARLSLLRAGSREEDIRQAQAVRDAAAADLDSLRAQLDQCTVHAPVNGVIVDMLANPGQFFSLAVPQPLLHLAPDGPPRIRAEVEMRDAAHVCTAQKATVMSETFPNATIRAQVVSVGAQVVPRTVTTSGSDDTDKTVLPVMLSIDAGAPMPPIGSAVIVHFVACPSKS